MPRTAAEESERLHMAKQRQRLRSVDAILIEADTHLLEAKKQLAVAMLAATRGRAETPNLIAAAGAAIEEARQILVRFYDEKLTDRR